MSSCPFKRMQNKIATRRMSNKTVKDLSKLKYFGTTVTDRDCVHVEIKSQYKCLLHSSLEFLSFILWYKNVNITIYATILLTVS